MRRLKTYPTYLALFWVCFSSPTLNANPEGGTVVNGSATFNQQGNSLTVTNTPGTIINWQDFSIQTEETTRFVQQSADSAVLNRVVGQDPSQILGNLQSNGRVFIINPNGIVFGADSIIDVSGLAASTMNLSNEAFLSQNLNFTGDGTTGNINNQGVITTSEGGFVYLIASNVENHGVITSPKGEVILAAGHSVQLVSSDDPDIRVTLTAPVGEALNVGEIITRGGKTSIYAGIINQQGKVNADSAVVGENGKIFFKATQRTTLASSSITTANGLKGGSVTIQTTAGLTEVSGKISAIGSEEKGGDVLILGDAANVIDGTNIDVSGKKGGGTVLIGGSWQNNDSSIQQSINTLIEKNTIVKANAIKEGNGGTIVAWSDITNNNSTTLAYGTFEVKGGEVSGDGGRIETSGAFLNVAGIDIDATAVNGVGGEWLLDPFSITIDAAGPTTTGTTALPNYQSSISSSIIWNGDITSQLNAGTSVTIQTGGSNGDLQGDGDITVNAVITKTAGGNATLTFNAHDDVIINNLVQSNVGVLNVVLNADQDSSGAGAVYVNHNIYTNGGFIKLIGNNLILGPIIDATNIYIAPSVAGTPMSIGGLQTFDISQGEFDNITTSTLYIGTADGSTITSGIMDITSNTTIEAGTEILNIYSTGNTTIGAYDFAATGGEIHIKSSTGSITTGAGLISSDILVLEGAGLITIDSGGITTTNYAGLNGGNVIINGSMTSPIVYLSVFTPGSAISIGGGQTFNIIQPDIDNINAGLLQIGNNPYVANTNNINMATALPIDFGARNVVFESDNGMLFGGSAFKATGGNLTFNSTNIGFDITTGTGNIAANSVTFNSARDIIVNSGGINVSNSITLNANNNVFQNGNLTANGAGTITVTATTQNINMTLGTVTTGGNGDVIYNAGNNITLAYLDSGFADTTLNAGANILDINLNGVNNINANNFTVVSGSNASLDYQTLGTINSTGVVGTADLRSFPAGSGTTTTTTSSTNEPLTTTVTTIANTTNTLSTGTTSTSTTTLSGAAETDTTTSDPVTDTSSTSTDGTTSETTASDSDEEENKDPEGSSSGKDKKQPKKVAKKLPAC